jgi:multiple sugar transport system permease protein
MTRSEFTWFVLPSVVIMSILLVAPLLYTGYLSVQQVNFGLGETYIGLRNFSELVADSQFWNALGFTLLFVGVSLPLHTLIGIVLALMLEQVGRRWKSFLMSAYAMPFILTPVVGTLVFSWFFKDYWGLFPYLLGKLGIHIGWFSSAWPARAVIILWGVWWTFGFNVMVLSAGLQTLPEEQIRAALVDGATYAQRIRHIVIPHLAPFLALATLFNIIDGLRVFDSVWVITKGGPGTATETLSYMTYRVAFVLQQIGKGSALSVLTVMATGVLIAPVLFAHARQRGRGT